MRQDHFSKSLLGVLFLIILFIPGCSIPKPSAYPPANPLVFAFHHTIDLTSLKTNAAADSLLTLDTIDGGIKLFANSIYGGGYEMEAWLNDTLILVNINNFLCDYTESIHTTAGKVRFEARLRKERSNLREDIYKNLNSGHLMFYNKSSYVGELGYTTVQFTDVHLDLPAGQLSKAVSLPWQGAVFENPVQLNFKEGILNGDAVIRDTQYLYVKKGSYDSGFEEGEWKVFDWEENLQWIEWYDRGELQKLRYEKGATMDRPNPIPTFRSIVILHRAVFYLLLILIGAIIYLYIKSLLKTRRPYKGDKTLTIVLKVLAGPFLAAGSILVFYFSFMILAGIFQAGFWDLPMDIFLLLSFALIYFLIGTIFFIATFRYLDVFWHAGLLILTYLITEEYLYLASLEVGIF